MIGKSWTRNSHTLFDNQFQVLREQMNWAYVNQKTEIFFKFLIR